MQLLISFLRRVAGLSFTDRVESFEYSHLLGLLDRMPAGPGTSHWQETSGKTQDTPERLCLSAGLRTPSGSPKQLDKVGEGTNLGFTAQAAVPSTRFRRKQMDEYNSSYIFRSNEIFMFHPLDRPLCPSYYYTLELVTTRAQKYKFASTFQQPSKPICLGLLSYFFIA